MKKYKRYEIDIKIEEHLCNLRLHYSELLNCVKKLKEINKELDESLIEIENEKENIDK